MVEAARAPGVEPASATHFDGGAPRSAGAICCLPCHDLYFSAFKGDMPPYEALGGPRLRYWQRRPPG
jgi:hypothetical protein